NDVRLHAAVLDRLEVGRGVVRDGHVDGAARRQVDELLHHRLAVGGDADGLAAAVAVDGGGEDLRAGGGGVVLQHFHFAVERGGAVGLPLLRLDLLSLDGGDQAAGEQLVRRGDGFVDVAAGIA